MAKKELIKKFIAVFMVLLIFIYDSSASAAEKTARLRNSLDTDYLYQVLTPDHIGSLLTISKSNFKAKYDDKFVAVPGSAYFISSNHKSIKVFGKEKNIEIDTSDSAVIGTVGQLKSGDKVMVYCQVDGTDLEAKHIVINPEKEPQNLSYVFYLDKTEYYEPVVSDLAADGHVSFHIPETWNDEYVMGRLTNNNVNGYQFFLNAIYPQNREFPENFYIFYFNYETYLDKVKKNPDSFDIEDIEELIIDNIVQNLSGNIKIDVSTIKLPDGTKLDYCPTVYKPADGNDYRLEFLFKSDSTGIICMLYLYYPNDYGVNHLRDVSYVVQTIGK